MPDDNPFISTKTKSKISLCIPPQQQTTIYVRVFFFGLRPFSPRTKIPWWQHWQTRVPFKTPIPLTFSLPKTPKISSSLAALRSFLNSYQSFYSSQVLVAEILRLRLGGYISTCWRFSRSLWILFLLQESKFLVISFILWFSKILIVLFFIGLELVKLLPAGIS
jgi:hypothetical protein